MTVIEKILSRASGRRARTGDMIWADIDLVTMRDFGGPNVVAEYRENFGGAKVFNPKKIAITFDLHVPARDERVAQNQQRLRVFGREQKIRLFDVNAGIGQHILFEQGCVRPGDLVVGTDSHMNLLGSIGAAAFGMGTTDICAALYTGRLWFRVPPTVKIIIEGTVDPLVTAKDVILFILKKVRTDGLLNNAVEFSGATVEKMTLAQRITICSMVTEMSGEIGFINPSRKIIDYLRRRAKTGRQPVVPDPDAAYAKEYRFNVDGLLPQVACPHLPDNVKPAKDLAAVKVDQVFIGSCTNGRYEDLALAASILKGRRIKPGLRMIIVPATTEVAAEAVAKGLYRTFIRSGAVIANPGCSLCTTGHPGILAPSEVMLSTSNRNFVGKLGKGGIVYLGSPAVAAATAITGRITDPRELA